MKTEKMALDPNGQPIKKKDRSSSWPFVALFAFAFVMFIILLHAKGWTMLTLH